MALASPTDHSTIALIESDLNDLNDLNVLNVLNALSVDPGHLLGLGEAHLLGSEPEHRQL